MNTDLHLALLGWQNSQVDWARFWRWRGLLKHLEEHSLARGLSNLCRQMALTELADWLAQEPWLERNHRWIESCERDKIKIIYASHADYPRRLLGLERPPLALTVLGHWPLHNRPSLAVVGSREPRSQSLEWMDRELARLLALVPGLITVSGGARGIDQRCHLISIRARQATLVVLPGGLERIYPRSLESWRDWVLEGGGAWLSPFAPDCEMRTYHFERRNQIIAQLADALLVVECASKSGSYMTGRLAMEREKPIGVVPGHPTDSHFAGSLELIANGPWMIRDAQEISELLLPSAVEQALAPRLDQTPQGCE